MGNSLDLNAGKRAFREEYLEPVSKLILKRKRDEIVADKDAGKKRPEA
jgi:hypothetical protein